MIGNPQTKFPRRRHRRFQPRATTPTPPPAFALASAVYDKTNKRITLHFNHAIDIAGLDGTAISIFDGSFNLANYIAIGTASLLDPMTVQIGLFFTGAYALPGVKMSATNGNGIVAADDGGTWAGVTDLSLPFS